jgi:hypothetical protein
VEVVVPEEAGGAGCRQKALGLVGAWMQEFRRWEVSIRTPAGSVESACCHYNTYPRQAAYNKKRSILAHSFPT